MIGAHLVVSTLIYSTKCRVFESHYLHVQPGCDGHTSDKVINVEVVVNVAPDAGIFDPQHVEEEVEHEEDASGVEVCVEAAHLKVIKRNLLEIE